MRERARTAIAAAIALMACTACEDPLSPAGPRDTGVGFECPSTLDALQQQVFSASCASAGCHGATSPAVGLDLASPGLEARLVGVPSATCVGRALVLPGDPDASFLIEKLSTDTPACGSRMPLTGALDPAIIECVRAWVAALPASDGGVPDGGGMICGGALVDCGGGCVDVQSDPGHCGSCGNACGTGEVCSTGACLAGGCPGTTTECSGACVDAAADELHCGDCTTTCGAGEECVAGSCGCLAGLTDCSGTCVDLATDEQHCGSCTTTCAAGTTCSAMTCGCPSGLELCGGACLDTTVDPTNCGGCGITCGAGEACEGGSCVSCGPASTLSGQVQPIFTAHCTNMACHGGVRPAAGLSLVAGSSYSSLVNVLASGCTDGRVRVRPSRADQSYLVNKLTGVDMCFGMQMPLMGTALSSSDLALVRSWICRGAPND